MSGEQVITARLVWLGPGRLRGDLQVHLRGGLVVAVEPRTSDGNVLDLGDGMLLPGLVNAHTHVELSSMRGRITPQGDFMKWLLRLVELRPSQDPDQAAEATAQAAQEMADCGTALVGDITNTGLARQALHNAGLHTVSLFEALGAANCPPPAPEALWRAGVLEAQGVAAHSPYSVPGWRIKGLKRLAGDNVFCIHMAESKAEMEFIAGVNLGEHSMHHFLAARGVNRDELGLTADRPLQHLINLGGLDQNTLLIHCVQLNNNEIAQVAAAGASVCICPRSNLGLTRAVADVQAMRNAGINLCLGTDSLSSCPDLNLWRELAEISRRFPGLAPESILAMATCSGAKALGLNHLFGFIGEGAVAPLCYVGLDPGLTQEQALAAVVNGQHASPPRAIGSIEIPRKVI